MSILLLGWWNGRHWGLKIPWEQSRAGSTPVPSILPHNVKQIRPVGAVCVFLYVTTVCHVRGYTVGYKQSRHIRGSAVNSHDAINVAHFISVARQTRTTNS